MLSNKREKAGMKVDHEKMCSPGWEVGGISSNFR